VDNYVGRALARDDLHPEFRRDVGMEPNRHLGGSELLERLVERDVAAVDFDADLGVDRGRDIGGGYRSEETTALTGAGQDLMVGALS